LQLLIDENLSPRLARWACEHGYPAEAVAAAGGGADGRCLRRLGRTRIGFPLSRQDPQPERTTQPPATNEAPPAPAPARAAAPTAEPYTLTMATELRLMGTGWPSAARPSRWN
jgi:hypothetical protein